MSSFRVVPVAIDLVTDFVADGDLPDADGKITLFRAPEAYATTSGVAVAPDSVCRDAPVTRPGHLVGAV
jgi:hypothetical protein